MKREIRLGIVVLAVFSCIFAPVAFAADGLVYQSPLYDAAQSETLPAPFIEQNGYEAASFESLLSMTPEQRVVFAQNSYEYLIAPGDSFSLTYFSGIETVSGTYQIDSSLKVFIPEIGSFDCNGISFADLRDEVIASVESELPYSSPIVRLISCGVFPVNVIGEVSTNASITGWGGCTLRSTMGNASVYASSRDVTVISADGGEKHYDLYKSIMSASRDGDPFLRPGDTVVYSKSDRTIVLDGAVYRPGTYQILAGETLGDLIERYGGGLLPSAGAAVSILRYQDGKAVSFVVSAKDALGDDIKGNDIKGNDIRGNDIKGNDIRGSRTVVQELKHLDRVSVAPANQMAQVVTIEGAVAPNQSGSESVSSSAGRLLYSFFPGERVSQLLKAISGAFIPQSDLDGIYLVRGSRIMALESGKLLNGQEADDPELLSGDKLIIPFSQTFVTVNGAVNNPGRIAYVPDKPAAYYIGLSGGYSSAAKSGGGVFKVYDASGSRLGKGDLIPNGAIISVEASNFTQNIALAASIVSLTLNLTYIITNVVSLSK